MSLILWGGWGGFALLPILLLPLTGFALSALGVGEDRAWLLGILFAGMAGVAFVPWLTRIREQRHPPIYPYTGWRRFFLRDHVLLVPLRYAWVLWAAYATVGLVRLLTL